MIIIIVNDELLKKIEFYVNLSFVWFDVVKEFNDFGIFCGILLIFMFLFLIDNKDEIWVIVEKVYKVNVKFIYCMYGVIMCSG